VVVTGAAVFLYALLYLGIFMVASTIVPISNLQQLVFLSLVALLPASVGLALGQRWAYFAVAALLVPGLALTVGSLGQITKAADTALATILLGIPFICLVVIVRRVWSRSN
jgi:hypothetical protein